MSSAVMITMFTGTSATRCGEPVALVVTGSWNSRSSAP
jgi:hypothetical protein